MDFNGVLIVTLWIVAGGISAAWIKRLDRDRREVNAAVRCLAFIAWPVALAYVILRHDSATPTQRAKQFALWLTLTALSAVLIRVIAFSPISVSLTEDGATTHHYFELGIARVDVQTVQARDGSFRAIRFAGLQRPE